jgi:hypothetical protein
VPLNGAGAGRVDAIGHGESVPIPPSALLRGVGPRARGIRTYIARFGLSGNKNVECTGDLRIGVGVSFR